MDNRVLLYNKYHKNFIQLQKLLKIVQNNLYNNFLFVCCIKEIVDYNCRL